MGTIEIARQYLGKKEKPNNSGFEDPEFEADMKKFGKWQKGFSWCACFMTMVFAKAYPDRPDLHALFDPSTRKTYKNFEKAGFNIVHNPMAGALVIWGDYKRDILQWTGHTGIVSEVITENVFKSIEGNTSAQGSRNGDRVAEHERTTDIKANGLNVMGFITI
jgi:hypothetical protein